MRAAVRQSLPAASFQPSNLTSRTAPGRRGTESGQESCYSDSGCSWPMCVCRKMIQRNGTGTCQTKGNQRLLLPHLYRDLSPQQHPGSGCCTECMNCILSAARSCWLKKKKLLPVFMFIWIVITVYSMFYVVWHEGVQKFSLPQATLHCIMANKSSRTFCFKRSHAKEFGNLGRVQSFQACLAASSPPEGPDRWIMTSTFLTNTN